MCVLLSGIPRLATGQEDICILFVSQHTYADVYWQQHVIEFVQQSFNGLVQRTQIYFRIVRIYDFACNC